jgi:hypothetical protein
MKSMTNIHQLAAEGLTAGAATYVEGRPDGFGLRTLLART